MFEPTGDVEGAAGPVEGAGEGVGQASASTIMVQQQLDRLAELDVDQHPDVYQRIHAELQDALAGIDDA